ncbi:thioredoxin family protein [Alteribacillus sp. YIM 98480]|uniref:thioredoxin family protein n=1 Tax=Alteribacillus sp. YIM 98480 TaxID=2606599 RepID=UPI001E449D05|nr:thioredoxin family protein [Alteribacillus sp. YIM 98480]
MIEKNEKQIFHMKASGEFFILFLYSPLCGTCKKAEQMMFALENVFDSMLFVKANINTIPSFVREEKIKSIPCLQAVQNKNTVKTIYAFHSIPSLVERLHPIIEKRHAEHE